MFEVCIHFKDGNRQKIITDEIRYYQNHIELVDYEEVVHIFFNHEIHKLVKHHCEED